MTAARLGFRRRIQSNIKILPGSTATSAVLQDSSSSWFQWSSYCCVEVAFNSIKWVRHDSGTTSVTCLREKFLNPFQKSITRWLRHMTHATSSRPQTCVLWLKSFILICFLLKQIVKRCCTNVSEVPSQTDSWNKTAVTTKFIINFPIPYSLTNQLELKAQLLLA